nr:hypothetical protein [Tanacetum cinerariifolium]
MYRGALILTFLASLRSAGSRPRIKYSYIGVIYFSPFSAAIVETSLSFVDMFANNSTNTSLVRCSKVIEASLLRVSAFLFWFFRICSLEYVSKLFKAFFFLSRYCFIAGYLDLKSPFTWLTISFESTKIARLLIPILSSVRNTSYFASLFMVSNSNHRAYMYSFPSGLININPAPEPLELKAPLARAFLMGVSVNTQMSCALKYIWSLLIAWTRADMSFSNHSFLVYTTLECFEERNLLIGTFREQSAKCCKLPVKALVSLSFFCPSFTLLGSYVKSTVPIPLGVWNFIALWIVDTSIPMFCIAVLPSNRLGGELDLTMTKVRVFVLMKGLFPIVISKGISPRVFS